MLFGESCRLRTIVGSPVVAVTVAVTVSPTV
jgi:hypothetical protein